ncbi:MAG TPA: hypothetical protein VGJ67_06590 [Actinomycetota bacterium]
MQFPHRPDGPFPPPPPPAEIPPPPAPPGAIFGPPARSSRAFRGPWIAGLMVLVLVGAIGASVVAPILASSARSGEFTFLERRADGSPVRWDPCRPIHFETDLAGAPQNEFADVQEALRRVTVATHIRFVYDGPTNAMPAGVAHSHRVTTPPGENAPPVLIAWLDQEQWREVGGTDKQVALALPIRESDGFYYDTGFVAVNGGQHLLSGFGIGPTWGPVILHELGHIMGLGHVAATDELMNAQENPIVTDFGKGDLEGLKILGRHGTCAAATP